MTVATEPSATPLATLRVDAGTMARFANGGVTLAEAESEGLRIQCDRQSVLHLLDLLALC